MSAIQRYTLPKEERLHGKNEISRLLAEGRFGNARHLKYCARYGNGLPYHRLMVSVPKKLFKRAVKRNLLKRRLRECFRLQKFSLPPEIGIDLMLVYNTTEILSFSEIYKAVESIIDKTGKAAVSQMNARNGSNSVSEAAVKSEHYGNE